LGDAVQDLKRAGKFNKLTNLVMEGMSIIVKKGDNAGDLGKIFIKNGDELIELSSDELVKILKQSVKNNQLSQEAMERIFKEMRLTQAENLLSLAASKGDDFLQKIKLLVLNEDISTKTLELVYKNLDELGSITKNQNAIFDILSNLNDKNADKMISFAKKLGESKCSIEFSDLVTSEFFTTHKLDSGLIDNLNEAIYFYEKQGVDFSDVKIIISDGNINKNIKKSAQIFNPNTNIIKINLNYDDSDGLITQFHEFTHKLEMTDKVSVLNEAKLKNMEDFFEVAKKYIPENSYSNIKVNSLHDTVVHKLIIDKIDAGEITQFTQKEYVESVIKRYNINNMNLDSLMPQEKVFLSELNNLGEKTNNKELIDFFSNLKTNKNYEEINKLSEVFNKAWSETKWK